MEAFIVSLGTAAVSALAFVAYRHPRSYRKIAWWLIVMSAGAALFSSLSMYSAHVLWVATKSYLGTDVVALNPCKLFVDQAYNEHVAPYLWILPLSSVSSVYLMTLLALPYLGITGDKLRSDVTGNPR